MYNLGLIDSGVGGITVVKKIKSKLSGVNIEYYGDSKNNPYGELSKKVIYDYSKNIIEFLRTKHIDGVILACNTISAAILPDIKEDFNFPIIGIINSGAEIAVKKTKNERIGVIGTNYTINSGAHKKLINNLNCNIEVTGIKCPELVELAEKNKIKGTKAKKIIENIFLELRTKKIDTIILGCTHIPLFIDYINEINDSITIINPAEEVVNKIKNIFRIKEETEIKNRNFSYNFYTSGNLKKYEKIISNILNENITAKKKNINN